MSDREEQTLEWPRASEASLERSLTIGVIMATHNRAATTRRCLESLLRSTPPKAQWKLFVHDDGSSDGTIDDIVSIFPSAVITRGTGSDYWARSMATAEEQALQDPSLDSLLWLNDDVIVSSEGLLNLYEAFRRFPSCIAVGVTSDTMGNWTYGGLRRSGRRPLQVVGLGITDRVVSCETMHGNAVLMDVKSAHILGGIDGGYPHAYADIDYGLRATRAGIPIIQMAGVVGTCEKLAGPAIPRGILARWRFFNEPKHSPLKAQVRIAWKFGGPVGATLAAIGFFRRVALP